MLPDAWVWIIAVIVVVALLFLMVYLLLAFDELRHDHKNPIDVCNQLNPVVLPEYVAQGALTVLFLVTGHWLCFLVNAVLAGYHASRFIDRRSNNAPMYDPTEMFSRDEMSRHFNEAAIKLGFYMLTFFYFLYRMMYALLTSDNESFA